MDRPTNRQKTGSLNHARPEAGTTKHTHNTAFHYHLLSSTHEWNTLERDVKLSIIHSSSLLKNSSKEPYLGLPTGLFTCGGTRCGGTRLLAGWLGGGLRRLSGDIFLFGDTDDLKNRQSVTWNTIFKTPGPGCSKLTTSLVNVSLKFQMLISKICQNFWWKMWEAFNASLIFSAKNIYVFGYIVVKHLTSSLANDALNNWAQVRTKI